jgi:hypothetical protein
MATTYLPREIVPISYVAASLIDLAIALCVLLLMMGYFSIPIPITIIFAVPIVGVLTVMVIAICLFISSLQVRLRDVNVALPLILQVLVFTAPIVYPASAIPAPLQAQCCLGYEASEQLSEVQVTASFNWPSGYLCTQLSSSDDLQLMPGYGTIRFNCPSLTMQRGTYNVDILIERRVEILHHRPRCSLLRVNPGKIVAGDFYLEHSCVVR